MTRRSDLRFAWFALLPGLLGGCAVAPPPVPAAEPLPPLPATRAALPETTPRRLSGDPLDLFPPGPPVTLKAVDVDVRAILVALAENAGISLVLDPDVRGRVTVSFADIPARDALRAVADAARLSLDPGPPPPLTEPVIFYALPVNVHRASAELIQERFGVGPEIARMVVEARTP